MADTGLVEKLKSLEDAQRATMNILEDFDSERARLTDTQKAVLNILDDFGAEKARFVTTQTATLNILDDFDVERGKLSLVQRATYNILEDFDMEKNRLNEVQKSVLNILDDLNQEKTNLDRANQGLQQKTEDLARSNKELEQFAYIASHDLQEPLRMVASYTQLLGKRYQDKLDADANEFIGYAVDGSKRLQVMINDLLEYSRVGTRGGEFKSVESELALKDALANLEMTVKENQAEITHVSLPTIMADKVQLAQLFQNLIGNGIKFKGKNSPRIHICAEQKGAEWIFSVKDNGIGISQEFHDRIFQIFQRLHTREEYPGSGIGLAICKKIVERHGGRIWIESEPEKGSVFYFTLPERERESRRG